MQVHHNLSDLPTFQNAVITIGSFDGVHTGHQKIIEKVNALAKKVNGESILITFHPHPRLVLYPDDPSLKLISTIDEKVALLERFGIDHVVVVPFTKNFSQQSPDAYIQEFLVDKFHPSYIVIGYDHKFGKARAGDIEYLKRFEEEAGFKIVEILKQEIRDIAVSSTKVRHALEQGDIQKANQLLNHTFTLSGTVEHGQEIGKTIGYPTANIKVGHKHKLIPAQGIYAVEVIHRKKTYGGMLYIGDRPTLDAFTNHTIEVNIFDFDATIYGDKLTLRFLEFIRADEKFDGLEKLKLQLGRDQESALKILKKKASLNLPPKKKNKPAPKVAIVILNYNGIEHLYDFLPSVIKTTYPNHEIIVADNGSTDDSVKLLKDHFEDVTLIEMKENYGFAKGYNEALKQVESDYYVLLNSDVEVEANWIEPIIKLLEKDATVGACQPKIRAYTDKKRFEYAGAAGGWIDNLGYPFCRGRIFDQTEIDEGQYDQMQEIFWASGAALFIRSKIFHALGGFDGDYFAHSEEIDLCWRIKRAGFKIVVEPKSVVYHLGGGTLNYVSPNKTFLNFRNSLFTLLKNEERSRLFWLIPTRLLLDGVAAMLFLTQRKFSHITAILKAHFSFYKNFSKMRKKRNIHQDQIDKISISSTPNLRGRYGGSLIWQYYVKGKKKFKNL